MSQAAKTTVHITFRTPSRTNGPRSSRYHKRQIEDVPISTAWAMRRDFAAYLAKPGMADRQKLYRYDRPRRGQSGNEEAMIALDYEEVISLHSSDTTVDTAPPEGEPSLA